MKNFYSHNIPKCTEILFLLNELLRQPKRQFEMKRKPEEAVTNIKETLSKPTMLSFPKIDAPLALMTDASNHSVGTALNQ